ncbi:hypothetical protein GW793_03475 [bacterium]|uniref:Uncharacterized protein n=2 Tax=Katanobacteria TaxID=422282 RepID=A0A2M7X3V8_UNCKA|nr:hypothetical protein [bacterium]PIP56777.1 MAG: hypothetical protein COX05_01240 [candidate division WWE3 bacterium CG22_combo_CG10-13_8_21_14_all_39_12]PJA40856.1 MAG: hypothetical protein CO179_01200 [candidate division WWE3 bacterium CG_4_9_14_3_um_filter_39_7]
MNGYSLRIGKVNLEDTRTRQYVGVGATVLWLVLLIIIGLIPAIQSALSAQSLIVSEKATESALVSNVAKIKQAQQLILQAKESEALVTSAVPFTKKSITAVNEIDLMTAKHGLAIDNLAIVDAGSSSSKNETQSKTDSVDGLVAIGFTLGVNGSYEGIRDLIKEFESLPRLIKLTSIDIGLSSLNSRSSGSSSSSDNGVPVGKLSASILGSFYYNPAGDSGIVSSGEAGQ